MSNEDSFNDSNEMFSLYSSKKIADTFNAQLKKIAANKHLGNDFSQVNSEDGDKKTEVESTNREPPTNVKKKEEAPRKYNEPAVMVIDDNIPSPVDSNNSFEDAVEIITQITARRTRQSQRLKSKQYNSGFNSSGDYTTDVQLNKRPGRGRRKGAKGKRQKKKLVDEITLDDSHEQTELDDELNPEVTVKVIWKSVYLKKFQIRKFQKLSYVFEQLAQEESTPEDKIILTLNNTRVSRSDTPDSLNLQVLHFLDGGVLSESLNLCQTPSLKNFECDKNSVVIKFQDSNKKIIKLNLNKSEKLKVGMIKYSEQLEIPLGKLRFFLDGELVESNETPASLGLESEEIIDVKIAN